MRFNVCFVASYFVSRIIQIYTYFLFSIMKLFNLLRSKQAIVVSNFQNYIFTIIRHTGPMTVHNYMREMLTHDKHVILYNAIKPMSILSSFLTKGILHPPKRIRS